MLYFQGNGSIVWGRVLEFSGKTETWWTEEKNKQLQERFHVTKNLTAVFIDSWSQQPWNLQDELQQVAFRTETKKLWETFSVMDSFEFNTIQDVIKELNECNRLLEGSRPPSSSLLREICREFISVDQDRLSKFVKCLDLGLSTSFCLSKRVNLAKKVLGPRAGLELAMHIIATNYRVRALDRSAMGLCFLMVGLQQDINPC